jgi:hypothetical protein
MIRRHIHFFPKQIAWLTSESRRTGAAFSELVRRAVNTAYAIYPSADGPVFVPMPKVCQRWLSNNTGPGGGGSCGGKIRPSGGFHKCNRCGASYGPVSKKGK